MPSQLFKRLLLSLVALVCGFGGGLVALGYSAFLAGLCPTCAGFHEIAPRTYVEVRDPKRASTLLQRLEIAQARVEGHFGSFERPVMLFCYTPTCNKLLGDLRSRAMAYGAHLIYFGPDGQQTEILAHELAHIALHQDIGLRQLGRFPAWVDEGIATYVSRDPRFDLNAATCDPGQGALPDTARAWRRSSGASDARYYAQAGCRVAQWVARHPISGFDALVAAHLK